MEGPQLTRPIEADVEGKGDRGEWKTARQSVSNKTKAMYIILLTKKIKSSFLVFFLEKAFVKKGSKVLFAT